MTSKLSMVGENFVRWLLKHRQVPVRDGSPFGGLILPRTLFAGVYGHRNVWQLINGKKVGPSGPGDPGDWIFKALLAAGFDGVEV